VSKAHDDSRASKDPTRGSKVGDAKKVIADGATPRRIRQTGPRERSGPIGISSGDFATPTVRKRTTTQPRGVPVVGGKSPPPSLDEPVTAASDATPPEPEPQPEIQPDVPDEGPVTPAPEPLAAAMATIVGAMPAAADALDAVPVAMPIRPPPPPVGEESPFGGGASARLDMDAEAAALAAEAAAVRALDSGPLTPPPELIQAPPSQAAALADAALDTPTPPPEVHDAAIPTPAPEVVATRTPPPEAAAPQEPQLADGPRTPAPEITAVGTPPLDAPLAAKAPPDITVIRTPPPELVEATRTPAPDFASVRTPPPQVEDHSSPIAAAAAAAAAVADEADQVTPPPEVKSYVEPAAPPHETNGTAAAMPAMAASEGLADLPAAALTDAASADTATEGAEGELDGDEHVEMMESTDDAADGGVVVSPAAQARSLRNAAPPPIPGSHLRTPGPEPIPRVEAFNANASASAPALPILPEAITQRPRRPKRSKPWFEEVFDEDYLRTLPFMRADQTLREVEFIADALRIAPGAEILDIACGYGRHAIELVQRGYNVTGLDLSLPLLLRAADESKRRALSVNFVHADMREMAFEKQFDGAYSMLTSFGYFDEDTNLRVAERIGRALKPGARLLLDIVNRDYVVSDLPVRVWWEGTGCVVLEEVDFNFHTSRIVTHRSIVFEDGRQLEQEISVRAYSLHEIGRLLRQAGFRVMDVSGGLNTRGQFFGNTSRSLLIVAEKRESDVAQPL
jgi:SAM-dependent methyltransferase